MNIGIIGKSGEDRVTLYLRKKGFEILKRNYQCKFGEIDIIAKNSELIIFVEVKTRKKGSLVSAGESVDSFKQQRITLTANDFLSKTDYNLQPRFDVAEVTTEENDNGETEYSLNYIKNAF